MEPAVGSVVVVLAIGAALLCGFRWLARSSSRYRGSRIVTCPETKKPAIVEVDWLHASLTSTVGLPDIRLEECSRWPMREQCGQECLMDLDVAPEGCLVSGVLMRWYRDKNCVYCGRAFPELHWGDHRPGLLSPEGKLLAWSEVNLAQLRSGLEAYAPVCCDCFIAQNFRLDHPELVVFRPWRNGISRDVDGSSASRHP